eukprot:Clim_evm27s141 gene=Clim_evmTU27s141
MSATRQLLLSALVGAVAVFYGIVVAFKLLQLYFTEGKQVFRKSDYSLRPQTLDDVKLGEHGFVRANGMRFHFVSKGSGPLLLLLHGFPENWYSWRHQLVFFSEHYQTVAVDLRGYGESERPPKTRDYEWPVLVEDIAQIVKGLGHEKATVISHDWGGMISWLFVLKYPHMVDKLIIANCPHPKAIHPLSSIAQLRKSWYIFLFQLPWLPEFYLSMHDFRALDHMFTGKVMGVKQTALSDEELFVYRYYFAQPGGFSGPINYFRNVFSIEGNPALADESVKANCPILLLWGEKDGAIELSAAKQSLKMIAAGKGQLKIIPGASHWVQQDAIEEFNTNALRFLLED